MEKKQVCTTGRIIKRGEEAAGVVHRLKGQKHTNGQDFQLNGVIYNKQGNSKDEFPCLFLKG
ncbi:hypothetical protein D4T97_008280 [Siminovitchia acidinfaciens]|uniref:Uncharacterized protein n=1 Tax=Siminovitchia acidinfaciens TaxID=2321395 RepID=A0A429Y1W9_9BACI|nr:hypothetical protein [Siminovitchia acidinfaciens]RST75242.1 hypothetical protein D4T97_008280 [Siminovitchia acidinfaciens]